MTLTTRVVIELPGSDTRATPPVTVTSSILAQSDEDVVWYAAAVAAVALTPCSVKDVSCAPELPLVATMTTEKAGA